MAVRVVLLIEMVIACAWQVGASAGLQIHGVRPELGVVLVACVGLILGPQDGAILGLACGVLEATQMGGLDTGALLVSRLMTGYVAGHLGQRVFSPGAVGAVLCVTAGLLTAQGVYFLIAPYPDFGAWVRGALSEALYGAVLAIPAYRLNTGIVKRLSPASAPTLLDA
jgi:hypothetical protein